MNDWPWWAQFIADVVNGVVIFIAAWLGARTAIIGSARRTVKQVAEHIKSLEKVNDDGDRPTSRD